MNVLRSDVPPNDTCAKPNLGPPEWVLALLPARITTFQQRVYVKEGSLYAHTL